jgi:hypothetical protein
MKRDKNHLYAHVITRWSALLALVFGTGAVQGFAARADAARVSASPTDEGGRIVVEVEGVEPDVPVFFSAVAEQSITLGVDALTGETSIHLSIVQGVPEILTLGLSGDGEVYEVAGLGIRDWSIRQGQGNEDGRRYLDLHIEETPEDKTIEELDVVIRTRLEEPELPGSAAVLILTAGDAVGYSSTVLLDPDPSLDLSVVSAIGLAPISGDAPSDRRLRFQITGEGRLTVAMTRRGGVPEDAELIAARLAGKVTGDNESVTFRLIGEAVVRKPDSRLRVLAGRAGLTDIVNGKGWRVELVTTDAGHAYEVVFDREGRFQVDLAFAVAVDESGDWRSLRFTMPAGAVVPIELDGLDEEVEFDPSASVVPGHGQDGWQGFVPGNGEVSLAWKRTRKSTDGALFFSSTERADLRVGGGLLRQASVIDLRILQGELNETRIQLEGPGEILGVEGENIVGWTVVPDGADRRLDIRFARPIEDTIVIRVRSQQALGPMPVSAESLRLTPVGSVRHSGLVRIANSGAVRLEVGGVEGLLQLAPDLFGADPREGGIRQIFVYRFPSGDYRFKVTADQIQPEVGVSQIVTYELDETDRVIQADLELDIREAPLRDWTLRIPSDYVVVSVTGNEVADYLVESEVIEESRALKILFNNPVQGRQLLRLRLEKNQAAGTGLWQLPPLVFPGAVSVRGHVGAVSVPGYRLVPGEFEQLVEIPLSYFPRQTQRLQQAWRIRESDWTVELSIEALGQSIEADVFHLYSVKEGVVHGSVLMNYFVVGAPATEWKVAVPESAGNVDVVGQNVRRDWRRDGDEITVSLHQPVLGAATLLVTFEQPMSAHGGTFAPGQIRPLDVQGERGYVQIVSPLQVKYEIRESEAGLLKLEPLELPAEYRLLTSAPSLAAYQYTSRPFSLEMDVQWYDRTEMVEQVVDFAHLNSVVSRDGQVVTNARFFVKTRGRKALRMILPDGVHLWEARVDGTIVNARTDGEQTLIPLSARINPNDSVEVTLRFGQEAGRNPKFVKLSAPRLLVPTVINEWSLRGDPDRVLIPRGGNADLTTPAVAKNGFEWVVRRGFGRLGMLLGLVLCGGLFLRARSGWRRPAGTAVCGIAILGALFLMLESSLTHRVNTDGLSYAASVVPAGEAVSVRIANLETGMALISWFGILVGLGGFALMVGAASPRGKRLADPRVLTVLGTALLAAGVLAQGGGAVVFFGGIAAGVSILLLVNLVRWFRDRGRADPVEKIGPADSLASIALIAGLIWVFGACPADLSASEDLIPSPVSTRETRAIESMTQDWEIRDDRLFAEVELTVRGVTGDSFVLLREPAVLTGFEGEGLRVAKIGKPGGLNYFVALEKDGVSSARVRFEMNLAEGVREIPIPTGAAALQRVRIDLDQEGWEFTSASSVRVLRGTEVPGHSRATVTLAPGANQTIRLEARGRDTASEETQFFVETANLFAPGPGVVNGVARVTVRPAQGRVSEILIRIPEGFAVGDVRGGPVGEWRFDPGEMILNVAIEPQQVKAFGFVVETQTATDAMPVGVALEPVRVLGASGEVGMIALAFGGDAQPEGIRVTGLSAVNIEDFDHSLAKQDRDGRPGVVIQNVWRYGQEGGRLELTVAPVAAEVRVAGRQVFSLDDDRLVLAAELKVSIMRVGLFTLSFELPDGLEVEALSGPSLSHWTENDQGGTRIVTLHLVGQTMGDQAFTLTLVGPAPGAREFWSVPRIAIREATRQTGELLLVPGKGIRLRAVERSGATQLDPRSVGGTQPGTLAFRLLQQNWKLGVGIEVLDPWTTVQSLQEVTIREGQTLTHINAVFRVENAAVRHLRIRLPGLSEDQVRTIRGSGSAVSDFVAVREDPGVWEIQFQRGIVGETDVQIEYQGQVARAQNASRVMTPDFADARQAVQFVAVRGSGRLELAVSQVPRGWQRIDWSGVPTDLQNQTDRSVPALCYRVAEPEAGLEVTVSRHEVADALKLRVTEAVLNTVFSPDGSFLTGVQLRMDVLEKSTLQVRLPEGAELFNTVVNGETVSAVMEGDGHLFYVSPNTESDPSALVRFVYSLSESQSGRIHLEGPSLSTPLENVRWRVVLPQGFELDDYDGGLQLVGGRYVGRFGLEQYQAVISSVKSAEAQKGIALLEEASSLLQRGKQQEAGEVLQRASNAQGLDEASNEDARVQLRALKTQQAVLGLNTRRQRLYLDNRLDTARNEQLEQAATLNPFMQGRLNFDPRQVDQLLMGNTVEENAALRGIAARLVDQQLAVEPTPAAIEVTLPERGEVLTFSRSLQVDGDAPLNLELEIERIDRTSAMASLAVLIGVAVVVFLLIPLRQTE